MTVREMLKELKKEAKRNGIIDMEINDTSVDEKFLLMWLKVKEKEKDHNACFNMGYLSMNGNITSFVY